MNYETSAVDAWFRADASIRNFLLRETRRAWEATSGNEGDRFDDTCAALAASWRKQGIESFSWHINALPPILRELLSRALANVDYYQIAKGMMEEMDLAIAA